MCLMDDLTFVWVYRVLLTTRPFRSHSMEVYTEIEYILRISGFSAFHLFVGLACKIPITKNAVTMDQVLAAMVTGVLCGRILK